MLFLVAAAQAHGGDLTGAEDVVFGVPAPQIVVEAEVDEGAGALGPFAAGAGVAVGGCAASAGSQDPERRRCPRAQVAPVSFVGIEARGAFGMTSIERTAYPRFKRLITAHELHLFFSPSREEVQWATDSTDSDGHLLALLLALKSYQRMGRFPKLDEIPDMVVDFVRRMVDLPEGTRPAYASEKTAKNHRALVRRRLEAKYNQVRARKIAEAAIRVEAASKNRPADLINVALEKVVEAGLELPAFSTRDAMASKVRGEVNASICAGIHDRMSGEDRAVLLGLLENYALDGTTRFNQLKQSAQGPSWSHRLSARRCSSNGWSSPSPSMYATPCRSTIRTRTPALTSSITRSSAPTSPASSPVALIRTERPQL
ncbi:DUF4158 domain-containing protein [Streptomyces sp. NPDC058623]|uniref:DUF4158 domain-containing protein n=1 Tax=Streptomyces sp. NPDC058623 TaxID=3346563 RepID=UPI0036569E36